MIAMTKKTWLTSAILAALTSGSALAANVPAGVQLAERQEIVKGNGAEPQSLDPQKTEGVTEANISYDLFEGLVTNDGSGKIRPGVASSWESKEGGKQWIFHLRPEAKWSNGQPVTAKDFVYGWRRLADPKTASPYASYLQYGHLLNSDEIIAGKKAPDTLGVKALDDHTLAVTLSTAVPYFAKLLIHPSMSPLYAPAIEKYGEKWTQPGNLVGNGAYKLKDWVVNERVVVERNPQYWDNAHTVINQVTFLPIPSEVTDVNRYRSGSSDMTFNYLPIELYQKLIKEIPKEVHADPYLCTYFYEINNQKPPFNDARVRTALKLGLDRDIMASKVKGQGEDPAWSFTPPYIDGLSLTKPEWASWTQAQRNAEAKKLLAEAGYGPDKPLTFSLLYNTSDLHKKLAIAAAAIWKKNLGANVEMRNQEWKTYLDTRHQGNYNVARAGWCADYNEPSTFLNYMLSNSSNNTAFYKSAEYDSLIARAMAAPDDAQRTAAYDQAEKVLDKDSAIAPAYYYKNLRLVKPYVGGYSDSDPLDYVYDKDLWIVKH